MTTPDDSVGGAPPSYDGQRLPAEMDPRRKPSDGAPRVTRSYRAAAAPDRATLPPGAPSPRRRPGRRAVRMLSWVAVSLSVTVLAVAVLGYVAVGHYNNNISRIAGSLHLPGAKTPPTAPRNATNYLLVGSDSRAGLAAGQGTQGTGATFVTGQRSDTVILAHFYGGSDKAQLVSFPRDSYVEIPAFTDPNTGIVRKAHHEKLNAAFAEGGAKLLVATIELLTNIRVDHFLSIDFTGFKGMVDKLGGVDVCLQHDAFEHDSGIALTKGNHHVNGDEALAFVRQRKKLPDGDIDRIRRQQFFIGSVVRRTLSAGTLLNPFKLNGFLNVATSSLTGDSSLSGGNLKDLALRLRGFSAGGVIFSTIPVADIGGVRHGASVVLLDQAKDEDLFAALRQDRAPDAPAVQKPAQGAGLTVQPSAVRLRILNGAGINGLGRKATADLTTLGFTIVGVPTNRGRGASATTISYGPAKLDSARTLAAAIPGSLLQEDPSLDRTLELVVGSSYTGAQAVRVTTRPPPRPSSSAAPIPKVVTAKDASCAP